jgi:hypothetical protein
LYILEGSGSLYYKKNRKDHELLFKEGDGIFTGRLTHCVKNTGTDKLSILFYIAPLPMTTIIYGGRRDRGLGYVDYAHLDPPVLVHPEDVKLWHFGSAGNRNLITPDNAKLKYMGNLGTALEKVGKGTRWHTHTIETGQEDIFYIKNGRGIYVYLQNGKVHTFDFEAGDAILSKHLTNYTWNTGTEDMLIPYSGAPLGSVNLLHEGDLLPL